MRFARLVIACAVILPLVACGGSIVPLYEEARDEALATPPAVPDRWEPDVVLHLSKPQIDELITEALEAHGTFDDRIEREVLGIKLVATPELELGKLDVGPSDACPGCVAIDASFSGDVGYNLGGQRGKVPVKAKVGFDTAFSAKETEEAFTVTVKPRDVRTLDLTINGLDASLTRALEKELGAWVRNDLLKEVEPIEVGRFGGEDVPLLAVRVRGSDTGSLYVEMLTESPSPEPIDVSGRTVTEGFELYASQGSLLDLAKKASFEAPPVSRDCVVEPTALDIDGERFTLGMRVWRPVGKGWWRDYTVTGTLEEAPRGLKLVPADVVEGEKSKGAEIVDPISFLGEGFILKTIEESIATTLPSRHVGTAGGFRTRLDVDEITGDHGILVVTGEVVLDVPKEGAKPREAGTTRPR